MNPTHIQRVATLCAALGAATLACDGDHGDATASTSQTPPTSAPAATTARATIPTPNAVPPATTDAEPATAAEATSSTVDDNWKEQAAAVCAAWGAELPSEPDPHAVGIIAYVAYWRGLRDRLPTFDQLDLPDALRTPPTDVVAATRRADDYLTRAEAAATGGNDDLAARSIGQFASLLEHTAALVTVAGAECGDSARAANASLNVPLPNAAQVAAGFGSVWVGQQTPSTDIVRVDPDSGEVLATIDVGAATFKAQPADGRMIVRTADAYVAIDPATSTIVATLRKSDVGPAANRSWAVDGAMWVCDGQQLHRYDPATFGPAGTTISLGIDCGQVYATTDLVVAWNYNEDDGESGSSAAVFIDPATNEVLATTPLPADPTVPIVLDDTVFFPANEGTQNAVIDRATWTVTASPDYGRQIGGSQLAYDGQSIYLIADGKDILVIDTHSYELTDVIEPLTIVSTVNALAYTPGALWVATGETGILQRFDIP